MRSMLLAQLLAVATLAWPSLASGQLKSVVLRDVQGLEGGQNLYVTGDGKCVVQIVRIPDERRYELTLDGKAMTELVDLVRAHRFFDVRVPDRLGVPDEARPTITVVLASGKTRVVAKWANDRHPDFDAVYDWLLARTRDAGRGKPTHQGRYDERWRPPGFVN